MALSLRLDEKRYFTATPADPARMGSSAALAIRHDECKAAIDP
jgi:hypothetical protein